MFRQGKLLIAYLATFVVVAFGANGYSVSWGVTQSAAGSCPSQMTGPGGNAYDSMINDAISQSQYSRRRLAVSVTGASGQGASASTSSASCVPLTWLPPKDERRRLDVDGCTQCTGTDDDDDNAYYSHDDGIGGNRRLNAYDDGYVGAYMTFTVTAQVPVGEDPIAVMNEVEGHIVQYFSNGDTASSTWVARALAQGADIPEDTQIVFSEPVVESDSVHISRPGDFIDHHYHGNSNVRIGAWIGASLAGVALLVSAKYGVKAYRLKRDATEIEEEKAAEWANMEEAAGDITLNPLAAGGGAGAVAGGDGVRQRSNSYGKI
mmetsp:Transcript_22981/g.38899  ORF Transcript_22981/g.38899 Transcript_22981/m.38899 type:complete len:320 (-) Transcript_22981:316-1275(-)